MRQNRFHTAWKNPALVLMGISLMSWVPFVAVRGDEEREEAKLSLKVERYLGKRVVSTLGDTTKIEAFRVDPKAGQDWAKGTSIELDRKFATTLSAVLLDAKTYRWEGDNPIGLRCIFEPGVAYRFWKDKGFVSVLVCFKCGEVLFVPDNPADKADPFRHTIVARH